MAAQGLEPVYLITGGDLPKVALALRRLRARFDPGSIETLAAESAGGSDAIAATNALGLFGGGERLVIVEGVERWKKADVEQIVGYGRSPTAGAVLALVGDAAKLPAGLEKACGEAGQVLRYDVPKRRRGSREVDDYVAWARVQLEQAGVRADPGVAERLVELVGDHAHAIRTEVEKLGAYAAAGALGIRDVEALVVPSEETPGWALSDAWGSRDVAAALAACEAQLLHEEPFIVAYRLAEHAMRVRAVHALLEEDVAVSEIAQRLGLKPYPARKQAEQARRFAPDELGRAVERLAGLDHAVKGGSRLDATLELERALVEVTAGREPAST